MKNQMLIIYDCNISYILSKKRTIVTFSFFWHLIMLRFCFVKNKWNELIVKTDKFVNN